MNWKNIQFFSLFWKNQWDIMIRIALQFITLKTKRMKIYEDWLVFLIITALLYQISYNHIILISWFLVTIQNTKNLTFPIHLILGLATDVLERISIRYVIYIHIFGIYYGYFFNYIETNAPINYLKFFSNNKCGWIIIYSYLIYNYTSSINYIIYVYMCT